MFEQNDSIEVMLSEEEIQARVAELGAQITRDFKGQPLHVIGVLKGSFVFLADLVRHIDLESTPVELRRCRYRCQRTITNQACR